MMNSDKSAVEAVQQGDKDRFSELVERHQRMVYAIAWSHLGDVEMCEDAAQETFLKAFRYLRALRNPEKFGGWLARIARNVCATILQQRKVEFENRRRWQMEQPVPVTSPEIADEEEDQKETLSRTMADLKPQYRECLVLFYLEGKSVAETSEALGISESATRTRLHRARLALRGRLEQEIERGLEGLTPPKNFSRSVMMALPMQPMGVAGAGAGTSLLGKVLSVLGKWIAGIAMGLWMGLSQAAIMYLLLRWFVRLESANFIDRGENDFRRAILRSNALIVGLGILIVFILLFSLFALDFSVEAIYRMLSIYCVLGIFLCLRQLRLNQSAFVWGQLFSMSAMTIAIGWIGFFEGPFSLFLLAMVVINLVLVWTNKKMPRRQDYNLFLRASTGLLEMTEEATPIPNPITIPEMRAFAKFLGSQWLIRDYGIKPSTLVLRLPSVRLTFMDFFFMGMGRQSAVAIHRDGIVRSCLNGVDKEAMQKLLRHGIEAQALEKTVSDRIARSLNLFLSGQIEASRRVLSAKDDSEILHSEYGKTKAFRVQHTIAIVAAVLLLVTSIFTWRSGSFYGWRPRPVTEKMARNAIGDWIDNSIRNVHKDASDIQRALDRNLRMLQQSPVHPTLDLIGKENAVRYKKLLSEQLGLHAFEHPEFLVFNRLVDPTLLYHVTSTQLLTRDELAAIGLNRDAVKTAFQSPVPKGVSGFPTAERLIELRTQVRQRLTAGNQQVIGIREFARRLYVLNYLDCLDLIDVERLSKEIAQFQVISAQLISDGFAPTDHDLVRGLFYFGNGYVLSDTASALIALESLGHLNLIDRQACVDGIMRTYRGRGIFRADNSDDSEIRITGIPSDAFYAMESLARLDALDQIKDFSKWRFRPVTHNVMIEDKNSPGHVTAESLEMWAYQERLEYHQEILKNTR